LNLNKKHDHAIPWLLGWVIQIGSDTIKADFIPNLEYPLVGNAFPIEAKITIGEKNQLPGKHV